MSCTSSSVGRTKGQGGFMLAATIGLLFFFSIVAVAILGYTMTVIRVTTAQSHSSADERTADSAMEIVISRVRADITATLGSGADGASCAGPAQTYQVTLPPITGSSSPDPVTVEVGCIARSAASGRAIDLEARQDGTLIGRSRVRFVDSPAPGYRLVVCDWELDGSTRPLVACP